MLNTTLFYLTLSSLSKSPNFVPFGSLQIFKSQLSFFTAPAIFSNYHLLVKSTTFSKFLSTAIQSSSYEDLIQQSQYFEIQLTSNERNLFVINCLFQSCTSFEGIGGGAICCGSSILNVNESAFLTCTVWGGQVYGGAIYSGSSKISLISNCFSECGCSQKGQALYFNSANVNLQYISVVNSGGSTSYGQVISINGFGTMQNINASQNLVQYHASALYLHSQSGDSLTIDQSTFVQNNGWSTLNFYLYNGKPMTISRCNFVDNNNPSYSLIHDVFPNDVININDCIFLRNVGMIAPQISGQSNRITFRNCTSDTSNWGPASTIDCIIAVAATHQNQFFDGRVCYGERPNTDTNTFLPSNTPTQTEVPAQTISLLTNTPIPTDSLTVTVIVQEVMVKNRANTVAIVFAILEAILLLLLLILIIYCLWKHRLACFAAKSESKKSSDQASDTFSIVADDIDEAGIKVQLPVPTVPRKDGKYKKSAYYVHDENSEEKTPGSKKRSDYPDGSPISPTPPISDHSVAASPRNKSTAKSAKGADRSLKSPTHSDGTITPSPKKKKAHDSHKLEKIPTDEAPLISDSSRKSAITIVFSSSDSD